MDRANAALVSLILIVAASVHADDRSSTTLWVWFGDHDLRGLHQATNGQVNIAYHARTLRFGEGRVEVRPRRGALLLDPETTRTAVVRIEVDRDATAAAFSRAQGEILAAAAPVFLEPRASGLQIDFDAPASFRQSYAALLHALRERLPEGWTFSMTALGSWCAQDRWLENVPVDRIVPMLFGPGHEQRRLLAALRNGPLRERRCRDSHGVREGGRAPTEHANVFVFPTSPWTLERAIAVWEQHRRTAPGR